jgi:hypothetical protein
MGWDNTINHNLESVGDRITTIIAESKNTNHLLEYNDAISFTQKTLAIQD